MNIQFETSTFGASISFWRHSCAERDLKKADKRPFLSTVIKTIECRRGVVATSTIENELTAVRSFIHYAGRQLSMDNVSPDRICRYERWLSQQGVSPNTSALYMRSLRAVLNRCGADGPKLFKKVRTSRMQTGKRAISAASVQAIRKLSIPAKSFLSFARTLFMFSIMAKGIPFIDLAHLSQSDIHGDHLVYYRRKTRHRVAVLIEPEMRHIIDRYAVPGTAYLFPMLHGCDEQKYAATLKRYNRALYRLSEQIGLAPPITSYTARHTWASLAYQQGVPLAVISKSLGHSSPVTTEAYLKEIDDSFADASGSMCLKNILQ